MLFNSFDFIIFFILVTGVYYLLPHKYRWIHLLLSSCIFYMAFIPKYILILFLAIGIDYWAGIKIENTNSRKLKKWILFSSIISTTVLLFYFKYYNFFINNYNSLAETIGWHSGLKTLQIILPIGLSFHTFQSLSYVIEVYYGRYKAERHFGIYALYVMFYPQLVAGPIERPQGLIPQLRTKHEFDWYNISNGLKRMAWGLFKKVVIADRLSYFVNLVYDNPSDFQGAPVVLATILFSFQIYCDFSGYSDIALGTAQTLGIRMMENFRTPYFSQSISEFWKRWHISLSSWFRDYLYIPLGGNRVTEFRKGLNVFITFLVSGFWHGANWTFIIWGGLHGTYLLIEQITYSGKKSGKAIIKLIRIGFTFILVSFAWIFFRAKDLNTALLIIKKSFPVSKNQIGIYMFHGFENELILSFIFIGILLIVEAYYNNSIERLMLIKVSPPLRWTIYYFMLFLLIFFGVYHLSNEFIYFQF